MEQRDFTDALEESEPFHFSDGFVAGARWWEYKRTGFTMWQGDQKIALTVAFTRLAESDPGELAETNHNRFVAGFVEGAKWWEFYKYDRKMSESDQELLKPEAQKRRLSV